MLLSNDYCMDFWNVFVFNVADMEGIYNKKKTSNLSRNHGLNGEGSKF